MMIHRSLGVQALRQCAKRSSVSRTVVRKFSAPSLASESAAPVAHPLVGVTTQFDHVAPRFEIEPSQIEILNSPGAFYETLKVVETDNELRPTG
jgi:CDP-diacylglycerol--glycerol-3-phosphate 3-phosphatidyltransferase